MKPDNDFLSILAADPICFGDVGKYENFGVQPFAFGEICVNFVYRRCYAPGYMQLV